MKKIKKTISTPKQIIPATEKEVELYVCGECDYETYNHYDAKCHHGKKHTVKEYTNIAGHSFLKFESKEKADEYTAANFSYPHNKLKWDGPGWYGCRDDDDCNIQSNDDECCPYGYKYVPAEEFIETWGNIVEDIQGYADEAKKLK